MARSYFSVEKIFGDDEDAHPSPIRALKASLHHTLPAQPLSDSSVGRSRLGLRAAGCYMRRRARVADRTVLPNR